MAEDLCACMQVGRGIYKDCWRSRNIRDSAARAELLFEALSAKAIWTAESPHSQLSRSMILVSMNSEYTTLSGF